MESNPWNYSKVSDPCKVVPAVNPLITPRALQNSAT